VDRINAEVVWGGTEDATDVSQDAYAGQGVKIAVLDTGIDYNHPDLNDNYVTGGYDYIDNDAIPIDENGHGTMVAGIIAAEDNGEGIIGVASKAKIYAVRISESGGIVSYQNHLIPGIQWAIDNEKDIISMSLGSVDLGDDYDDVKAICDEAYAAGIVLIVASGNYGGTGPQDVVKYPAAFGNVTAVGAIMENNQWWPLSHYGQEVELVAPGDNIYTTSLNNEYDYATGTSFAVPHVTGTVALMLSKNPQPIFSSRINR
jgi:subtilisin family serine protease